MEQIKSQITDAEFEVIHDPSPQLRQPQIPLHAQAWPNWPIPPDWKRFSPTQKWVFSVGLAAWWLMIIPLIWGLGTFIGWLGRLGHF